MTAAGVDELVAHARQHFEEGLITAGFIKDDGLWKGTVPRGAGSVGIAIALPQKYPFAAPRVFPTDEDEAPWSWHREQGGALCIVAEDDHENLWWVEASNVLDQAAAWFAQADAGWPDDRPDLDLDRYFETSEDTRIYIYEDFETLRTSTVRFEPGSNDTMLLRVGEASGKRKSKGSRKSEVYGYVADLGSIETPPRGWADLEALAALDSDQIARIKGGAISVLGLMYDRGGHEGLILLNVRASADGSITAKRLLSAANTTGARMARTGPHAGELAGKSVAIVGVGALGSFIADALARSGIGRLTLVDNDSLLPGNLIRHFASYHFVGADKASAVRGELKLKERMEFDRVKAIIADAREIDRALRLVEDHDLVVNATADFAVTAALHHAAAAVGRSILSAALQNSGETFRIDILPPLAGAESLPTSARPADQNQPLLFEPGCGSPVSPTPPYAVIEAAGAATRHTIGLLIGNPIHPAGEVRHLVAQTS